MSGAGGAGGPAVDDRSALFAVLDAAGHRPITYDDMRSRAQRWPVGATSPDGVQILLRTARETFALAVYHYELFVVAATWSLMAVEAALREHYAVADKVRLVDLIERAGTDGVLDHAWVQRLDAGRRLRNDLVHQRTATVWSPAMSADIIGASHEAVAAIFHAPAPS